VLVAGEERAKHRGAPAPELHVSFYFLAGGVAASVVVVWATVRKAVLRMPRELIFALVLDFFHSYRRGGYSSVR